MSAKLLYDIRIWILFAFLIRLVGITNPPLEAGHNWRQTTVTMVSRNFSETDSNILYPRIDFAGEKTGITGMEFPIFNYLIFGTNELFGYQHWYGRLINLIISSIGIYFFFLLVQRYFSNETAFWSSIILLFSVWFVFSRKIMPDTFSMSLVFIALYSGTNYLRSKKLVPLLLYTLFLSFGVLSKLPSGYILVLLIPVLKFEKPEKNQLILFSIATILSITPSLWWYFSWVPHLVETYGFWHFFMGKGILTGISEIGEHLPLVLSRFYDSALKFIGFTVFILGLIQIFVKRDKKSIAIFFLAFLSFLVIMFKAGFTFAHHSYYIIPFAPIMALVAGNFISALQYKFVKVLLITLIAIECVGNSIQDFRIPQRLAGTLQLEEELDRVSKRSDLIFINSGEVPTPIYFAHRKGWIGYNAQLEKPAFVDSLKSLGLKRIVVLHEGFGSGMVLNYPQLVETEAFTIYSVH